jgi:hypothetical protein
VQALGMSEGAAGRRVAASRACRRFPEAFERVAGGELHLSALCALEVHLKPENATELLEACRRKTRRQVDELLAAWFPKPDVREQIRRLPERKQAPLLLSAPGPEYGDRAPSVAAPPVAALPEAPAPRRREQREEIEPLATERFGVRFTADAELRELIERARALASHRLAKGELSSLMKLVLRSFVQREEARRFAVGRKPRKPSAETSVPEAASSSTPPGGVPRSSRKRSRHVPAQTRRAVYVRDAGQCSFVSHEGRCCEARAALELDHIRPWATHGGASVDNIRLRCRAHNQMHARKYFGTDHVAAKIAERRRGASLSNAALQRDI